MTGKIREKLLAVDGKDFVEELGFDVDSIEVKGKDFTLDVDGTKALEVSGTGVLTVVDNTNNDSAVFNVHLSNDVMIVAKAFGDAAFTAAVDTATSINVYQAGGKLTVQNKLAASTDLTYKMSK